MFISMIVCCCFKVGKILIFNSVFIFQLFSLHIVWGHVDDTGEGKMDTNFLINFLVALTVFVLILCFSDICKRERFKNVLV
jgi:membrane-anchored protein YejM (alkaline phosphatase superfamily)